ncbi:MAG TPA: SgcJ/EcaC family oxidoreductase [Gemmatimonadota bacterium]|nr:SgcJ/EcaC family oxidoreductase [Gemmatimonadota bacterium]
MSKQAKPLFAAVLAVAMIAGCQQEPATETGSTTEAESTEETSAVDPAAVRQAIEDAVAGWESAALAGDAAALAALYAEDAVLAPPNAPKAVGRAAIQAAFTEMLAATPFTAIDIVTDESDVSASGDIAWAHGSYTSTNTMPDGTAYEDTGKWLSVYENYDGQWTHVADTWNSDTPLAGPEEAPNP